MLERNRIIISGISGFVGSNLNKYLVKDYELQGVSRKQKNTFISYQNLTKNTLDTSLAFIHLAGKAHDLKNIANEKEYFEVNTELTKELFDKFLTSDCETFIFMSSVKAVADELDKELTEEYKPSPITAYGKSKLLAEQYVLSQPIPKDKRVYILRPCMIHGPNNKGNLNLLYSFVTKGIPYPFGKYENKRSFLSVDNLCFVIRELINNKNILSGVYNVSDDSPLSTKELVETIGKSINKKVSILNTPKIFISLLAKIGDVLPFPVNSERVQKLTENYVVSNKKIKLAMQKELPLSTKDGIEITIKSFNK